MHQFVIAHFPERFPLPAQDKESVARVVQVVDKANGYSYASVDANKLEFSRLTAAPPPFDDQR